MAQSVVHLVELVVVPARIRHLDLEPAGDVQRTGSHDVKALDIQRIPFAPEPARQEVLLRTGRGLVHGVPLAADAFQPRHWLRRFRELGSL